MQKLEDLQTTCSPTWCPGCGNLAIWAAFKNAAVAQSWDNSNTVLVAGIGCHGNILNFIKLTSFEGLHGRAIPVGTGIKLANHDLNVFIFSGDGDGLGEGGNHLIHACRRNHDLTVLFHDNGLYSLTTGQTAPTTQHGSKTKSTPQGNPDNPISPVTLAIASGATFVARAYSTDIPKLTEIIIAANKHKGMSVVDILQPCVTLNKECTHSFYQQNTYYLGKDHNVTDRKEAFNKSLEWGEKQIPLGIFYQVEKPSYESQLPQIAEGPLVKNSMNYKNLIELFEKYT